MAAINIVKLLSQLKIGSSACCKQLVLKSANERCVHTSASLRRKLDNRAHPPYKYPSSNWNRWEPRQKPSEKFEYTTKPLKMPNTGGRGPNGRIWNHKRGGGHKKNFRMIDWFRGGPKDNHKIEKVAYVAYDPNRSARIALVAEGEHKRWILATQHMKAGDLIKSSQYLTKTAVRASEGDAYPLGSLPVGTLVNSVQIFVGGEGRIANAAGVSAQIVRKIGDKVVVRMPSKREICVSAECQGTVGRLSNINHNKRVIGKAGRNRWLGIRPKSGRWHRKTGRFGRKIRPIKKMVTYDQPKEYSVKKVKFTSVRVGS